MLNIIFFVTMIFSTGSSSSGQTTENLFANYGSSRWQNEIINVPVLHNAGITGQRILIGMIDTGFDRGHEALRDANVIAEYDFINNDTNTGDEDGDEIGSEEHGTFCWSVVGGKKEGRLIGTAYGADFALAKTEIAEPNNPELAVEEVYYKRGLEWFDSLGVDVVSNSLVFHGFTDVEYYTQSDMDGKTAIATKAADNAVSKGMFVVTGAGNGFTTSWSTPMSPTDGFNVFCVGAVDSNGTIARFSSTGPTADGRMKPDVLGPGVDVVSAYWLGESMYEPIAGTSLATPAIAGVAALILSAHPELSTGQVAEALRNTASRANDPRNRFGHGIVDALKAASYFGPVFSNTPTISQEGNSITISTHLLSSNGINGKTALLNYKTNNSDILRSAILYNNSGVSLFSVDISVEEATKEIWFSFAAEDMDGKITEFPGEVFGKYFKYDVIKQELHTLPNRNKKRR